MSGNPVFVESGRRGARSRWGPPRTVRLDSLTIAQRAVVMALIDTMKIAPVQPEAISDEVRHDRAASQ